MQLDHLRHLRHLGETEGSSWWRRFRKLSVVILLCADTTTIRLLLANASALWALAALLDAGAESRPGFAVMVAILPMWAWAGLFMLHAVGVYWRLLDNDPKPGWALVVNTLGFAVWCVSTASMNLAIGTFTPGAALEWTMCAASAWALYRTGLNREIVTP